MGGQERKGEDTGRRIRKREEIGRKDGRWENVKIKERGKEIKEDEKTE